MSSLWIILFIIHRRRIFEIRVHSNPERFEGLKRKYISGNIFECHVGSRKGRRVVAAINNQARKLFIFRSLTGHQQELSLRIYIQNKLCKDLYPSKQNKSNKNPDKTNLKTPDFDRPNGSNMLMQHHPTLLNPTCCTRLATMLHDVA